MPARKTGNAAKPDRFLQMNTSKYKRRGRDTVKTCVFMCLCVCVCVCGEDKEEEDRGNYMKTQSMKCERHAAV